MKNEIDKMRPQKQHEDILAVRKISGEMFYKKYHQFFVEIRCPACRTVGTFIFSKYGFQHEQCKECKTIYTNPRPADDLLREYYADYDAPKEWTKLLMQTDTERRVVQHRPRVDLINETIHKFSNRKKEIAVDLGAGTGAFAYALEKSGCFDHVIAIDYSDECVNACLKRGLTAVKGSVDYFGSQSVDLLTMNDLIEHLFNPGEFLRKCFSALKSEGFISIACPSGEGFDFKIFKENTVNITPPEHLNYFNPNSLSMLLESVGFTVVEKQTPGILDVQIVRRGVESNGFDLTKNNEYINFLLFESGQQVQQDFQELLKSNLLSSHMLIIAQKQ